MSEAVEKKAKALIEEDLRRYYTGQIKKLIQHEIQNLRIK